MNAPNRPGDRATVRRRPERASYDPAAINAILDEALVCHVGFVQDGEPFVIPMSYARAGATLYFHGARAGRTMQALAGGGPVCIAVTLVDGIVLGATATDHSVNYRSAILFGTGRKVTDPDEKLAALKAIMEHNVPGRWADVSGPSGAELDGTAVAAVSVSEASAKVRSGPPAAGSPSAGTWTGVLPLKLCAGTPVADPRVDRATRPPSCLRAWRRHPPPEKAGRG
ncbi:MAG: pyridoxamine 5'-phosphate oxidase family protein [Gemmatimonadetes bacterium]|nr:pyridoxamine 5'-phosphate oxidase family protein [Gemmatimonadota bacterium]